MSHAALTAAVSTYDATNGNVVNTDATGNLLAFTSTVGAAFAAGFGGVADFEDTTPGTNASILEIGYAGGVKTLTVTSSSANNFAEPDVLNGGTVNPLSGTKVFTTTNGAGADVTFTIGPITGAAPGESVVGFGFTMLSRNTYPGTGREFTVTALFSNGGTSSATHNIVGSEGADDTFFGFFAPAGASIVSVTVDAKDNGNSNATEPVFDDFVFITVPEPSSAMLIGAGLGLAALRRRRA